MNILNKEKILKDYIKFCNDTKQETKSKKAKKEYIKYLTLYIYNFGQISINEVEKVQHEIENILKYNTLTIEHFKNNK